MDVDGLDQSRVFTGEELGLDMAFTIFSSKAKAAEEIEEVIELVGSGRSVSSEKTESVYLTMKKCDDTNPNY